ncbi:hypothetical protein EDB81DRAFT_769450 [Dactylonectria macrodidyma]|uniref:Uncharacterized protein n=1 Tax=Dactylonectria macrodidyma TaxID=307937 RepID=A0A9P9FSJ6_9HYPO|nr:hypothetical protein EDB81DRAFT_769450 [Dactylonectria macrodidyma]
MRLLGQSSGSSFKAAASSLERPTRPFSIPGQPSSDTFHQTSSIYSLYFAISMAGISEVGLALQVFEALCTSAKYIQRAAKDFRTAETQFVTLLEDVRQCERYATLVKQTLNQIPSEAMSPKEWNSVKKQLETILKRALDFNEWTVKNMINPKDASQKKLQKKFTVAFGKLRKINADLTFQFQKLQLIAPEITMRLQTVVLDAVMVNQSKITTLDQKMDFIIEQLSRLSSLIYQEQPPPYPRSEDFKTPDKDYKSSELGQDEKLERNPGFPKKTQGETNQQKSLGWKAATAAGAIAAAIWWGLG